MAIRTYPTPVAAEKAGYAKRTPIESFSRLGHWLGVVPFKLPNGHLRWPADQIDAVLRSEEHTSELQSLMRISYAVFCLKKKTTLILHESLQYIHQCTTNNKTNRQ